MYRWKQKKERPKKAKLLRYWRKFLKRLQVFQYLNQRLYLVKRWFQGEERILFHKYAHRWGFVPIPQAHSARSNLPGSLTHSPHKHWSSWIRGQYFHVPPSSATFCTLTKGKIEVRIFRIFTTLVFRACRLAIGSGGWHKLKTRYGMGEEQIKETTIPGKIWLKEDKRPC